MSRAAERAERIALAILAGEVSMSDARETLRLASREREVEQHAESLRQYRSGEPVWVWPAVAPWSGF